MKRKKDGREKRKFIICIYYDEYYKADLFYLDMNSILFYYVLFYFHLVDAFIQNT